jgi:hypothetical protein
MPQLIENPRDFACQNLEKKKNKILVRFISWGVELLRNKKFFLVNGMLRFLVICLNPHDQNSLK